MRVGLHSLLALVILAATPVRGLAADTCTRADFESAVGLAAQALKSLNQTNKPAFQAKLRQLKTKRGWTYDQFLASAAPIVQDVRIARYDTETSDVLARIEQLGAEGAAAAQPDCSRLAGVRKSMSDLVTVQQAKWAYMNQRIDAELAH